MDKVYKPMVGRLKNGFIDRFLSISKYLHGWSVRVNKVKGLNKVGWTDSRNLCHHHHPAIHPIHPLSFSLFPQQQLLPSFVSVEQTTIYAFVCS